MGTGALLSSAVFSSDGEEAGYPNLPGYAPGPSAILLRMNGGATDSALHSLQRIARATSTPADNGVEVLSVQRPAEIVNYRSMGGTPAILGAALAAGAVTALGLTLVASVRRRRRELALIKALGFTHSQLAGFVAWQSTVAVLIGTVCGIPFGIIVGRSLWILFAHEIDVIPTPTVPVLTVALIAVGALVLANLVAATPVGSPPVRRRPYSYGRSSAIGRGPVSFSPRTPDRRGPAVRAPGPSTPAPAASPAARPSSRSRRRRSSSG